MSKFIEELYYGNIDPQARSTAHNKKYQNQMEILVLNEKYLTENLTGENKKKFLEYVSAWNVVDGESSLDGFITGFRIGANFSYEAFADESAPFESLINNQ